MINLLYLLLIMFVACWTCVGFATFIVEYMDFAFDEIHNPVKRMIYASLFGPIGFVICLSITLTKLFTKQIDFVTKFVNTYRDKIKLWLIK
jgi:hypothetical protein